MADREEGPRDRMTAGYARAEEKNRRARESLIPLAPGERPPVVTVGAIFTLAVAIIFYLSAAATLVTGGGENWPLMVVWATILTLTSWGLWRAAYWAVLGFQVLLVLLILAGVAGMVLAGTLLQLVGTGLLTAGLGVMFFFMVKAMARIQMPDRPGH